MKILILGSGVIGTTAAYYLAADGHDVTVLDRQSGPALETSFANAGEVSPGYSAPWAAPGLALKALKWLFMRHRPLVIRPRPDVGMIRWGIAMLAQCNAPAYERNKARMLRLAEYSRDCLRELRNETGIQYDQRTRGTLQLFRTAAQVNGAAADIEVLRRFGVSWQALDVAGCVRQEPALDRVRHKFVGGLLLPGDETGDCHKFTEQIATLAAARGARFRFGVNVRRLVRTGADIEAVDTDAGTLTADRYLVALGSYTPLLLAPLGLRLPVYPVKGYSITVPISDARAAPESTVMDETHKVAVTRLGDRIRVGGTAELAGYDLTLRKPRRLTLEHVVRDLFPDGGDVARATFWTGLRPMTPDGTPIVGPTPFSKLWLSCGHGTLGWTMAAGSGHLLADWMVGREPAVSPEGLSLARYELGAESVNRRPSARVSSGEPGARRSMRCERQAGYLRK
ncbi:MAG TPA: D-amino acid dehydrogenase [Burkholderiaceae bacterium]|nr:D-amino acid dehydrogenase [Burkholderiaceae bacterium]